jgi:hypothetical protein
VRRVEAEVVTPLALEHRHRIQQADGAAIRGERRLHCQRAR